MKLSKYLGFSTLNYCGAYLYGKIRSYTQPYINTDFNIDKVGDNLYIGDFPSACNKDKLLEVGITHIITVIAGVDPMFPEYFVYKTIDICDTKKTDIYRFLKEACVFIDKAISGGGKVLVHCMCGVSRSATIVVAYLMYKQHMTADEAITFLKECRQCIQPNDGFLNQLKLFHTYLQFEIKPEYDEVPSKISNV